MKLLPFNLERALAGDKVVTRNGLEVTQLKAFELDSDFRVYAVLNDDVTRWTTEGKFWLFDESSCDLFMAPKTVKRWVNFYPKDCYCVCYDDEKAARKGSSFDAIAIAVPVEFEEGYGCE